MLMFSGHMLPAESNIDCEDFWQTREQRFPLHFHANPDCQVILYKCQGSGVQLLPFLRFLVEAGVKGVAPSADLYGNCSKMAFLKMKKGVNE